LNNFKNILKFNVYKLEMQNIKNNSTCS